MTERNARSLEERSPKKRASSARFLLLWTAAIMAAASAFVVHLAMRFETVRLGYAVGEARREQESLLEEKRLLSIEAATLRRDERVETIARGLLQMHTPPAERIVPMGERQPRRTAGRAR